MSALNQSFLLVLATAALAAGCKTSTQVQSPEPSRNVVTASDIHRHILGTWTAQKVEGEGGIASMTFTPDGAVEFKLNGQPYRHEAWRVEGGMLVVTPQKQALISNSLQAWIIWQIDEHQLLFRPGFSTAGPPERWTR